MGLGLVKNHNFRFHLNREADKKAWDIIHGEEVSRAYKSQKATKEPLVSYGVDKEGTMPKIVGMLKERKFMTYSHENMIFICPPLIISKEQLTEELAKMDEVLSIVDGINYANIT